jgi:hypothetical protein
MTDREHRLRLLCFWYECERKPDVAAVLQEAADAVRRGELDDQSADALTEMWRPLVRLEVATTAPRPELEPVRFALADLRRMLRDADDHEKPAIAELLREQVAILRTLERGAA